ncbi:hypothetical protein IHE45_11G038200 [Dioscorea alata]|uniref:Uncharacterized protein n=1 Tax=Dioscorea alata TaxID=55571 RepID=A0ACB7V6C2_DIOAL|nr:hypothetical protein IHE45_11G038200 [Dioscorea alata]
MACSGRVSAAPTRRAAGHDAHGPAKPGGPGDGRHHRESGRVARPPAKPHGRAMAVRAMSRATGGASRANPRHTQPRGTSAPHRGRQGTVGARPLCKGGLARNHHTVVGPGGPRAATQTRHGRARHVPSY